jgi:hypothetical protein
MTFTQPDKIFLLTIFGLAFSILTLAQDGSNIRYVKTSDLNDTHIDKKVHIDFYNRSFRGLEVDTILIAITDKSIKFVEHREDNGFNNWFSEQYLQSLDSIGNFKLRLIYSNIFQITRDEVGVVNYFNLYDSKNQPLFDTPFTFKNSYRRKSIAEVLVLSE